MGLDGVSGVHEDLGYTEQDAKDLKQVKLVWKKLEDLRKKAEKDPSCILQYRVLLQRSLAQARMQRPTDDWMAEYKAFRDWIDEQEAAFGISDKELRRGSPYLAWSEKWLPKEYAKYRDAVGRVCDDPSIRNIKDAKSALTVLLRAYVALIPDR